MPRKGEPRTEQELERYRATVAQRRAARTHKRCPDCEQEKTVDQFYTLGERLSPYCIPCNLERQFLLRERERLRDPEKKIYANRKNNLKKFGLTPESYAELLASQGGGCAVCGRKDSGGKIAGSALPVDHNHQTGETRGILCHSCNRGIGLLCDDPETVRAALMYLLAHQPQENQ